MARPLRIEYQGAHYHVTTRGNERKAIFRDDIDRRRFIERNGYRVAEVASYLDRDQTHISTMLSRMGSLQ